MTADEQEKYFREWLSTQQTARSPQMAANAISSNANAVKRICSEMHLEAFPDISNLFSVTDIELFCKIRDAIKKHDDYHDINQKYGNGFLNTGLDWYEKYLIWLTKGSDEAENVHYWTYAPGEQACMWETFYENQIMGIGWPQLGNLKQYNTKEELQQKMSVIYDKNSSFKNSVLAVWQFVNELKIGDIVYVKQGVSKILGYGEVVSDYEYNDIYDEEYPNIRRMVWKAKGSWDFDEKLAIKTLTDITGYKKLENLRFKLINPDEGAILKYITPYKKEDFLSEVFMTEELYDEIEAVLKDKKNIILQGAPGVGKTFIATRLAYAMMKQKNDDQIKSVQFHQNYSYEDFIMGYKPDGEGFTLTNGVFYKFCKEAENHPNKIYFFIIDEINRGNMSKIFGELLSRIEDGYRGKKVALAYRDELFSVPENLYLIGMMNTADRSLAMIDYALRRRFSFFDIEPGFGTEGFKEYQKELGQELFDALILKITELNKEIANDKTLGDGFCIGHSYFCNLKKETCTPRKLRSIVKYDILPMLKEYWFDEQDKFKDWEKQLLGLLHD